MYTVDEFTLMLMKTFVCYLLSNSCHFDVPSLQQYFKFIIINYSNETYDKIPTSFSPSFPLLLYGDKPSA